MSQLLYMGQSSNLTTPCSNTSLIPVFSENALNAKYWYSSQIEGVNLTLSSKYVSKAEVAVTLLWE